MLNPHISTIYRKYTAFGIYANPIWKIEMALAVSKSTPLGNEIAISIKLLNSLIGCIGHKHITLPIYRNAPG